MTVSVVIIMPEPEVSDKISRQNLVIKCGFPILTATYKIIKIVATFLIILLILDILFSLRLFMSAIKVRTHLGYFINMVSSGDGDILPSLQAVPVLFFLLFDVALIFCLYLIFDPRERPGLNRIMFLVILIGSVLLIILLIIIISVIAHAYSSHESLHDGIVTAMNNYSTNLMYKVQMDRLQIEFQCCGSKKYDEWYTIKWLDPSLEQEGTSSLSDGNTPFSCCSMKSLFPCIHHGIEVTGKAYLYTPEFNLSVSTRGCYEMLREKKQEIGWVIVANLFLFMFLQSCTIALFRFLQTAHFERGKFVGHSKIYTMWIFGIYSGKVKPDPQPSPPDPPPVPPELKN